MMGEVSNGDVGGRIWSCGAWLVNGFGLVVIWFVEARRLGSWFGYWKWGEGCYSNGGYVLGDEAMGDV
ncbi:hypothetical protein V6N13_110829 [Hibiscus sabdariffa]